MSIEYRVIYFTMSQANLLNYYVELPKLGSKRLFQTIQRSTQLTYKATRLPVSNKIKWLLRIDFFLKVTVQKTFLMSN